MDVHKIDWAAVMTAISKSVGGRPKASLVKALGAEMPAMFDRMGINTPKRAAHFLAQSAVECDYFKTLEEYASGQAYEGRTNLGNTQRGDGKRFKGRGIFQTTGRSNYAAAEKAMRALGFDDASYVANPTKVARPRDAVWAAGIYWKQNKLAKWADANNAKAMSRAINRGNGLSRSPAYHEAQRLKMTKIALGILENPPLLKTTWDPKNAEGFRIDPEIKESPTPSPPVPLPAEEPAPGLPTFVVKATQERLRKLGYWEVGQADGKPGPRTVAAVAAFQKQEGLPVTGQLDGVTLDKIGDPATAARPVSEERANTTVEDLREGGSVIVKEQDQVKQVSTWGIVIGAITTAFSAMGDWIGEKWENIARFKDSIGDLPGWTWGIAAMAVFMFFVIKAQNTQKQRLDDQRRGKTA
jgi:putative chitinase